MKLEVLGKSENKPVMSSLFGRLRVLGVMLLATLFLSGCVKYDAGVNFESLHRGEIVQHIKLGEQLANFSSSQAREWLNSVERRARQQQGKIKRLSDQEIIVTIPFYTGKDLEFKFNEFFNPGIEKKTKPIKGAAVDLPNFDSKFKLTQSNLLLFVRNKLSYDVDLRSLGVLSSNGSVIVSPASLFDLEFSLKTSGEVKAQDKSANAITPVVSQESHQVVWKLQPGEVNHLEAVFWLPSPIGIGTVVIVLLVLGGFYLKYKRLPGSPVKTPTLQKVP